MTPKQKAAVKYNIKQKFLKGEITQAEFDALVKQLDDLAKNGATLQEANTKLGMYKKAPDPGAAATETAEKKLEKELLAVYGQAAKEMKAKFAGVSAATSDKLYQLQQKYNNGEITKSEFELEVKKAVFAKNQLAQKIDQLTGVTLNANQKAAGMINGEQLGVFAENANYQAYQLTQDTGLNLMFSIYDENTVEKLIKEKPELMPPKVVNGVKDTAWNREKIANCMVQGILQGDSIPKLARRVAAETAETNMNAMVRYARTAMTSAQNSGRMETLHRAQDLGIKCKKCWLATLDSRTRDSHQKLDGVAVGVDDKFPNGLMFPGDPGGPGAEVWNCRCTLTYEYEDYPDEVTGEDRIQYDDYYTTETGKDGKKHKVYHRSGSSLVTDMDYGEWKAAKKAAKLTDLNTAKVELADAQKALLKAKVNESKVYKDLWKDPVTLADYEAKKGGIQAKRDYYVSEIDKYKDAQANGAGWATDDKIKELEKKKKLLDEFEKNGQLVEKRNEALKNVQKIYNQAGIQKTASAPGFAAQAKKAQTKSLSSAGEKKTQFATNAWDDSTKKAARNFGSKEKADKVLRPELDAIWDTLTDEEKYGVWLYTWNSNPINKPLSGYHDTWDRSAGFVGYDRAVWGHEDNYSNRDISWLGEMGRFARSDGHAEYKKGITLLTKAIEKSELQEGVWLVRGSDENGLAGWFAGAGMDYASVTDLFNGRYSEKDMQNALVGKRAINHAYTSTGIASGTGFGGNVKYRIYAPKGTKGIYAEPQSHYGSTTSDKIYKKGQSYRSVGSEAEVIVQRGTTYRCTGLKVTGYDRRGRPEVEIEMEIVEQPDYFKNGDEDTYNNGKTRHKR